MLRTPATPHDTQREAWEATRSLPASLGCQARLSLPPANPCVHWSQSSTKPCVQSFDWSFIMWVSLKRSLARGWNSISSLLPSPEEVWVAETPRPALSGKDPPSSVPSLA